MKLNFSLLPNVIAVVGSREFPLLSEVREFVDRLPKQTLIISGGAVGVDGTAERQARRRGMPQPVVCLPKPEIINKSGYVAALFARNTDIVLEAKERGGIVVAFLLTPSKTGGTSDTITKSEKHGVPCIVFRMKESGQWLNTETNKAFQNHPIYSMMLEN